VGGAVHDCREDHLEHQLDIVETRSSDGRFEVWIVSNLPPPVHGVSVFNECLLAEGDRRGISTRVMRVGAESGESIGHFSLLKAAREGFTLFRLTVHAVQGRLLRRGKRTLYFTPSQWGPATYRDAAVASIGRLLFDRVVAHVHGCGWLEQQKRGGPMARAMRHALRACDEVICLGPTFTSAMRENTGFNCVTVDNGARGLPDGKQKQLPPAGETVNLLYLGNFIRSKGLWEAAEAARLLQEAGAAVTLRCAGAWRNDSDRGDFRARFHDGISMGTIQVVGLADQAMKESLLRESHFLVLPTRYPFEGQPLALIESLSAGLVPIVTDQGGIPDLMQFPGAEVLVSAAHEAGTGVAKSVRDLLASPQVYESLSTRCLERYKDHLTFDRCADEVLSLLTGDLR
jgi:glycosyltransferase involved in cell wall biosynthesis